MFYFKKTILYISTALIGIFALLMLISAVLMAFTPEVGGWAKAGYIIVPLALFLSIVCVILDPDWGDFFQRYVIHFPIVILIYIAAAFPQVLTPLFASLRVWSGISIYGLFGSAAVWVVALGILECYFIFSLCLYLWYTDEILFPVTRFVCQTLYFVVLLPLIFLSNGGFVSIADSFPMPLIIIPALVMFMVSSKVRQYMGDSWNTALWHAVTYAIFTALTFVVIFITGILSDFFAWMYGVLIWYWNLIMAQPWTIIFAPIAWYVIYGLFTGKIEGGSEFGSSSSSGSTGLTPYAQSMKDWNAARDRYRQMKGETPIFHK